MEFRVLGPIEVVAAGRVTRLGRGHRRTLLALLLAAEGGTVTTDRLIDGLWGDRAPASARKSLQSHVSRLRSDLSALDELDSQPLRSEAAGYRVELDGHVLDAARFASLADRAGAMLDDAPSDAADLLSEALDLWRGPAYGDLASNDGIHAEAVRLDRMRARAAADLADARLALGRHRAVVAERTRAVTEEPLAERAHAQLMVALYRDGRQDDALATYQSLRERLRDELGVDPSPPLQRLHQDILRQDPALLVPSRRVDGPGSETAASAPDVVALDLIGREADVAAVVDRVGPGRLVTLTGPGGVGKTRLAEQVAATVRDDFPEVVVAELAAVRDPGSVGEALVTTLGIQPTGERAVVDSIVGALGERRLLLVLDNCEHVLATVAPLAEAILGRCPNVGVLATSRERLHLPTEQLWHVRPLDVPHDGADLDDVLATPAGRLFQVRAAAVEPSYDITEEEAPAVTELCRRLDGMPLAIELAAARVRAMTPSALVARLGQRFSLLAGGPRHHAGRHRTLQAVVAWSYDLLDPLEARLFDRLSVFAGTFSLDAVEQVCTGAGIEVDDVAGLMGELVDKSMVVTVRGPSRVRYRFLDTLREFAARRLAETDDPVRWQRRHAAHHVRVVEELGPLVRGPDEPDAVEGIEAAFDDIRSAHAWLLDVGDTSGALRIPAALGDYLFYRLRDEVMTWARRAVTQPGAHDDPAYAGALTTAAFGATSRIDCDRARREAEEARTHAPPGDQVHVWAHVALGTAALYDGRLDDLLWQADRVATLAHELDRAFHLAFAGVLRVLAHTYQGDLASARTVLPDLEDAAEASGSPTMRAFARYCRGEVDLDTHPGGAAEDLEEAVRLARDVGNALVEGVSMVSLASLRGRLGESEQALRQFRDVIAHWRRLGSHTHQLTTLRNLVVLLAQLEADEAAALLHGAVTVDVTPSFGLEAQRLEAAWDAVEGRLGADAAAAAADRGRQLTATRMAEVALHHVDALLDTA